MSMDVSETFEPSDVFHSAVYVFEAIWFLKCHRSYVKMCLFETYLGNAGSRIFTLGISRFVEHSDIRVRRSPVELRINMCLKH